MAVISPGFNGNYTTVYSYDLNNRLEKEVKTIDDQVTKRTETASYFYDPNGNQISKLNEQSDAMFRYGMLSINVLGMDFTPNGDGYGENDGEFIPSVELYVYDAFNRLIETEMQGYTIRYGYKADGMRLYKEINGNKTTHVWDGSNIVLEMNSSGGIMNRYIRGINLIKNTYQYFVYNAHGDVVQLTDGLGAVTKNYRYDAFGVETNIDKQDTNVWRYCGEYFDKETGTIYLRYRYYDPKTSRMLSEDSYRGDTKNPLGLNLYTYCFNNPIRYADPTGHWPDWSAIGNGIADVAKSFGNGFVDFFKGQWESIKGVFKDPIGSYVDYITELWSHPIKNNPLIKSFTTGINTIGGMWQDIFNQDYNSLAYGFGNRAAMGLEMVITAKIINMAQGMIGTGAVPKTSSTSNTTLYRAVSEAEYSSIMNNGGKFVPYEYAMEQKWFATTSTDAASWGKLFYSDGAYKIIQVNMPTSALEQLYYSQKLDGIGPAYCGEIDFLNSIMEGLKISK